jgi:hypothetical protein
LIQSLLEMFSMSQEILSLLAELLVLLLIAMTFD